MARAAGDALLDTKLFNYVYQALYYRPGFILWELLEFHSWFPGALWDTLPEKSGVFA